jgi:hypothetical protein
MKEALPVVPVAVPSGPSPQLSPSAISTARIRPVDLGKPRLPVWAAFGIGLVVAAAVTTLAVMFLL